VLYANVDIRTPAGIDKLNADCDGALDYLFARAYGPTIGNVT
jgi:hypothetical protein